MAATAILVIIRAILVLLILAVAEDLADGLVLMAAAAQQVVLE